MRKARVYPRMTKRIMRPEIEACLECHTRLRRYATVSERSIITLTGTIRLVHCGYRCPNPECAAKGRSYRSAAADALALPGFTFGLDIVLLVGHLRLAKHQTVDEVPTNCATRLLKS